MERTLFILVISFAASGVSCPAFACDALPHATQRVPALKDGSTLHAIEGGKKTEEVRCGLATCSKPCEVLEGVDGRQVPAFGDEASRGEERGGSAFARL
ncbi:MAG: CopK family periplasmic copper-binding protein [Burkholderiales bacterium]|nr:CopK family periplasmic copper-binding protein [Burkholderiales bacterium]